MIETTNTKPIEERLDSARGNMQIGTLPAGKPVSVAMFTTKNASEEKLKKFFDDAREKGANYVRIKIGVEANGEFTTLGFYKV